MMKKGIIGYSPPPQTKKETGPILSHHFVLIYPQFLKSSGNFLIIQERLTVTLTPIVKGLFIFRFPQSKVRVIGKLSNYLRKDRKQCSNGKE